MRNLIEHFDENLDDFLKEFISGIVMPKYVGPIDYVDDKRTFLEHIFMISKFLKCLMWNMK